MKPAGQTLGGRGLHDLLSELRNHDVQLWADQGRLRCAAPKGVLTAALQAELAQRKDEIFQFLTASQVTTRWSTPSLRRVPREGPMPLSFGQNRLWFLQQMEPESSAYNLSMPVFFGGRVGVDVIQRCLAEILRRHEILRTSFAARNGEPGQVIAPVLDLALPVVDLSPNTEEDVGHAIRRLVLAEQARPFDLMGGPPVRATLLRRGEEFSLLLLVIHHIAADGWSLDLLRREFNAVVQAFCRDQPSPLRELSIQYADYAHWQREWFQGEVLQRELAYWREQLADIPGLLQLPTDRPRPAVQTFNGATKTFSIPPPLTEGIRALAQAEGATVFMALVAAFNILLYRYSGQGDLVMGTSIANRGQVELEELVGFFVNTLALRTRLSGDLSFRALLSRVRTVVLEALAHQELPFEKLVEELRPQRNLSHSPIFQVMLTMQNTGPQNGDDRAEEDAIFFVEADKAKFDLDLFVFDTGRTLKCKLEYNTDLFEPATITRVAGHFQCLLAGMVARPGQSISTLPLLPEIERRQLIYEWNQGEVGSGDARCFHELVEAQVARTPGAVATEFIGQRITYLELNQQANQLAHHLQKLGVAPEIRVGVCVERSPAMLVALLGVMKAGGAYVPLDPTYPAERLSFMMADAKIHILLTQERMLTKMPRVPGQIIALDSQSGDWSHANTENVARMATPQNLAYVIYTSGSTGRPKGIMIPHSGLVNYLLWCAREYDLEQGNGALVHSSISFDLTITGLFGPLLVGRTVHLLPETDDLEALSWTLRRKPDLSVVKITPAHLELISRQIPAAEAAGLARAFIIGGDQLPVETVRFWHTNAPATRLINEYGPAETVVGCCIYSASPGDGALGFVPIGRPIAHTQIYILDKAMEPVPIGVPGELCIGGAGLARGYLERPDVTAERFIPHPFTATPGQRIYRTGDLARYRPDGVIECLGRVDHQVKIRGFRIELGEVEAVLLQHPAIKDAAVAVKQEAPGDKRLVAFLVSRHSLPPTVTEFRAFLLRHLPDYMLPTAYVFLDKLPLSPNGKLDRQNLPMPLDVRPVLESPYIPPHTGDEQVIAGIWKEVLGVAQVGVRDNFFELGGHSLLLVKVHAKLREEFTTEISLVDLFRHPTVEALARAVNDTAAGISFEAVEQRAQRQKEFIDRKRRPDSVRLQES